MCRINDRVRRRQSLGLPVTDQPDRTSRTLQRKFSLWQGWNRIVMITHVPVGPGAAIKDSCGRVVQNGLEIFLRKISQSCSDITERAIGHHMGEKQLHILQRIVRRLGPRFAVRGDSFRNLSPLGHADSCLHERNLIPVHMTCQSPKLRLLRGIEVGSVSIAEVRKCFQAESRIELLPVCGSGSSQGLGQN